VATNTRNRFSVCAGAGACVCAANTPACAAHSQAMR
jgi:hypothetical protein